MDIDLNADVGEGSPTDAELVPLVTSVNIACGFHAGDPGTALAALELSVKHNAVVGAHPSFPDREHFGRRDMQRSEQEVYEDCVYQVGALIGLARSAGATIRHVKPHGALYNLACQNDAYARPIVRAASLFGLALVGRPNSRLEALSNGQCRFIAEGFADRRYSPDGSLVPRTHPNAVISDPAEAVSQVERLIREKQVRTICIHGDNARAVDLARALRGALGAAGHRIVPYEIL